MAYLWYTSVARTIELFNRLAKGPPKKKKPRAFARGFAFNSLKRDYQNRNA
jgi:hypothetical protein